jgi:hypothetical protein
LRGDWRRRIVIVGDCDKPRWSYGSSGAAFFWATEDHVTLDLADPVAVLLAAAEALGNAGFELAAYGGLALAAYGTPRETRDADLAVITASGEEAAAALAAAGIGSLVAFDRVRFGGNRVTRLTLLPDAGAADLNTVDLVAPLSDRYARAVIARAYRGVLRDKPLRIVTPEDFVIMKVLSTRDRDLEDAAAVLTALADRIDGSLITDEIAALSREVDDHDVSGRYGRVVQAVRPKP